MELLRVKPAANRLRMSAQTLRRRIKENKWPTYELGPKCLLVDIDEILRLCREDLPLKRQKPTG